MTMTSKRRPLIAGNWKMYKSAAEAAAYLQSLKSMLPAQLDVDITIAPAFTALESAVKAAAGSPIKIAAQNVFWEKEGAFTGEISAGMLTSIGVPQVIIGHSERRQYFAESDDTVNKRVKAALDGGLQPIVCIGETLDQREAHQTFKVLENQLTLGLSGISQEEIRPIVLAYEPVWAIGTGRTATTEIAQEAHHFIREQVEKLFNKTVANDLLILYGGSVKPENAAALMAQEDIDGALVGGASLKPEVFIGIINFK